MQVVSSKTGTSSPWHKVAALALVVAALGLPINDLLRYVLLLLSAVAIFTGVIDPRPARWLVALAAVATSILGHWLLPAPRIEEGHNVFIVDAAGGALQRGLPDGAFRAMLAEFDATYPREHRCEPRTFGCWRGGGFPDRAYAFSADGILDRPALSRRVTDIDFSDPVWLRLGFINEAQYNWTGDSDIQRNSRKQHWWQFPHPWRLTMPYFVVYRFPAEFVGSKLCWNGETLWEGADGVFTSWRHPEPACRAIESGDIGRMIFGVSIASPLTMELQAPLNVQIRRLIDIGTAGIAVLAVLALLMRIRRRQFALPLTFIALALVVVFLNDASFIGGVRPFDGGDDGLFYEGVARRIVQYAMAGDFSHALEGGEPVFYYGGPGLRYLRAVEHVIFGDTFLGYLSLMLLLPFLVFASFRRFLGSYPAFALTLIFLAIPVGALFGTSFFNYAKWAARGFADPAAAALFLGGLILLVGGTPAGPDRRFPSAFAAAFLFALALWVRPNLAPGAAIFLGGAGLTALWHMQIARLVGLCLGFAPVFGMALHNWVFGHAFVLFSSNATITEALPMPPRDYLAALGELLRLDINGPNIARGTLQWMRWLAGPSESFVMVPLHLAAIAVLVRVTFARHFDPWIRLTAAATLALHPVAWFYLSYDRYYYLTWFLTLLVCAVWVRDEGIELARSHLPKAVAWHERHPLTRGLHRALDRCATFAGIPH